MHCRRSSGAPTLRSALRIVGDRSLSLYDWFSFHVNITKVSFGSDIGLLICRTQLWIGSNSSIRDCFECPFHDLARVPADVVELIKEQVQNEALASRKSERILQFPESRSRAADATTCDNLTACGQKAPCHHSRTAESVDWHAFWKINLPEGKHFRHGKARKRLVCSQWSTL